MSISSSENISSELMPAIKTDASYVSASRVNCENARRQG